MSVAEAAAEANHVLSPLGSSLLPAAEPRELIVETPEGGEFTVVSDPLSDRIRCDHPNPAHAEGLPQALIVRAEEEHRGRVVALVPESLSDPFVEAGYQIEGVLPGFYEGHEACAVVGLALSPDRERLAHPIEVARVDALVAAAGPGRVHAAVPTRQACVQDATALARLIDETFPEYPTPSHDPAYIASQLDAGVPFRVVEDGGQIVACASADLVREARTAELTDCATKPSRRGRGYMQSILRDLMADLTRMEFPTAFTLARARVAGVNIAFKRLGFRYRGRMIQSCRIGDGIEDMNIWSRRLA